MIARFRIVALSGLAILLAAAPAWSITRGLKLRVTSTLLATVVDGVVTGGTSTFPGELTEAIDVTFLDGNLNEFVPAGPDTSMTGTVANPGIAVYDQILPYSFTLEGSQVGSTTLAIRLLRNNVTQYTSPAIPIEIAPGAAGVVVRTLQGVEIAHTFEDQVFGVIRVGAGQTLQEFHVRWLGENRQEFDLRPNVGLSLVAAVGNESFATAPTTGPFNFRVSGVSVGSTDVTLSIHHIDHIDFSAPPIPIEVLAPSALGDDDMSTSVHVTRLWPPTPNPFNPTTTFRWDLAKPGPVQLAVFDARGRMVQMLVSGSQAAGRHDFVWRAPATASGRYFVRLATPDGARTTLVTLLK
jgi:hypothetical protein